METIITNLFAGPATGKSTLAAELFAHLKYSGLEAEYVQEGAKDLVWEKSFHRLEYQIGLFAEQHHRIHRLLGQVDVVVCDSPLLHSLVYGAKESDEFKAFVLSEHNKLNNINFQLRRNPKLDGYAFRENQTGRKQGSRDRAIPIDNAIVEMLNHNKISYYSCFVNPVTTVEFMKGKIDERLKGRST